MATSDQYRAEKTLTSMITAFLIVTVVLAVMVAVELSKDDDGGSSAAPAAANSAAGDSGGYAPGEATTTAESESSDPLSGGSSTEASASALPSPDNSGSVGSGPAASPSGSSGGSASATRSRASAGSASGAAAARPGSSGGAAAPASPAGRPTSGSAPGPGQPPAEGGPPAPGKPEASAPGAPSTGDIPPTDVKVPENEERQGVTDTEIVVGTTSASTGVQEYPGATVMTQAWLKMINDQGGVNGRKFRYINYNQDPTDSNKALANVRKLNEDDRIFTFLGGAHPFSDVIYDYMEQHGVPAVGTMSEIAQMYKRKFAFPTSNYPAVQCRDMGDYGAKNLGFEKVAIFEFNVYISTDCAKGFAAAMEANGKEVAYRAQTTIGQPDFTQEVVRARQAGAQFILCATDGGTCVRVMQAAQRQGWRPEKGFGACSPCYSATIPKTMGSYADGSIFAMTARLWTSSNPGAQQMVAMVNKYNPGGARFDGSGLPVWVGANLFTDAIKALGNDISRSRLMGWLGAQKAWTPQGEMTPPLDFTKRGPAGWFRQPLSSTLMGQLREGKDLFELTGFVPSPAGGDPTPDRKY